MFLEAVYIIKSFLMYVYLDIISFIFIFLFNDKAWDITNKQSQFTIQFCTRLTSVGCFEGLARFINEKFDTHIFKMHTLSIVDYCLFISDYCLYIVDYCL